MPGSARNLIVLSDGTGNSASKASKTNVLCLYQAIDLTDGTQIAVFGDGVGMSSVKASQEDFTAWTKSEQFRAAHQHAGERKPLTLGQFEGFEVIQTIETTHPPA